MMASRLISKKFALLFVIFIIIVLILLIWTNQGANYPKLPSTVLKDKNAGNAFNDVRFEDINAVVPYETFTLEERYTVDLRPDFTTAVPLLELEKENVLTLIREAIRDGQPVMGGAVAERHFQYGISRHLAGLGEEYTLVFRTGVDVFTARVYRPLKDPVVTVQRHERLRDLPVHIVMPLRGRLQPLDVFLDRLGAIIDSGDNVHLTVVAFPDGANGTAPVGQLLRRWKHAARAQLVAETGAFSRGRALMRGAAAINVDPATDPLLFLCDVDMEFSAVELERCRVHAEPGRATYYPVVFSQYNPRLRQALRQSGRWPPEPPVSDDTGHWRYYGYGMSCQYRSDFAAASGQFLDVSGWGGEDGELYRRHLRRLRVVRAYDDDLVHVYHGKECSERLSSDQYRSCVRSKIVNEGSKVQLGLLALSAAGDVGPKAYGLFYLPWFLRPGGWATLASGILLALSLALNVWQYRRTAGARTR
ncbi:chondroitin sulfate N-acetylgalactosaminyltransferase 1-like [Amphibalanus amphitrite]|uniref:chondroitin sulfate N-acetylgalactosaminyltransferase 1-like n=1 Tax=Amphibalanus amphitrite TaxID=1232801 RepID=UPI001C92A5CB|nr:chondroitin sulfate N-acetylgalactosaminyltransferase 1-like [Amphibalanus amphitrite]